MVRYCSAFGCKNTGFSPGISFFKFPKDPNLRKQWIIKTKRANFKASSAAVLCSYHFIDDDFEPATRPSFLRSLSMSEEKIQSIRPRLLPGAVPSRFQYNLFTGSGLDKSSKPVKTRGAVTKREHLRVLSEIDFSGPANSSWPIADIINTAVQSNASETEVVLTEIGSSLPFEDITDTAIQNNPPGIMNSQVDEDCVNPANDGEKNDTMIPWPLVLKNSQVDEECVNPANVGEKNDTMIPRPLVLKGDDMQQELYIINMDNFEQQETRKKQCEKSGITSINIPPHKATGNSFKSTKTQTDILPQECSTPKKRKIVTDFNNSFLSLENSFTLSNNSCDSNYSDSVDIASTINDSNNDRDFTIKDSGNPQTEKKYIVFETCLLQLFARCLICNLLNPDVKLSTSGTLLTVCGSCKNNCSWTWCSQPKHSQMPWGNLLTSAAIVFSGLSPLKLLRFFNYLHVPIYTIRHFHNYQKLYIQPVIRHFWEKSKISIMAKLIERNEPIIMAGDARCDSPGHCAKYGSYTCIDIKSNFILDFELVQSNEVKNSNHMELEGFKRCLTYLSSWNINISEIVSDRHVQIRKFLRIERPLVKHTFDVWHMSKSMKKKLIKISKKKGCSVIEDWMKSITNMLYWIAMSSNGNQEEMEAKWCSVQNHIVNIHEHESEVFPKCLHEYICEQDKTKWIKPHSKAHINLTKILSDKRLTKDIKQLSVHRTSSLEAFHSLILHFAPKNTHFWYEGMYCRLALAALHFNENINRVQAKTVEGLERYSVHYRKQNKNQVSVAPILEEATYDYAQNLLTCLVQYRRVNPSMSLANNTLESTNIVTPSPLTHSDSRVIPKSEAIHSIKSRYQSMSSVTP